MKQFLLNVLKFLLFLGIGLGILYYVYYKQSLAYQEECIKKNIPAEQCDLLEKVIYDFQTANYFWIGMVLLMFMISNISRAIRWRMLIQPLGRNPRLSNCFQTVMLGYFANLGIPRIGEVVRASSLARYEKMSVEKVMGTVVVDRIFDVICILILTTIALVFAFSQIWPVLEEENNIGEKLTEYRWLLLALMLVGLLGIGLLWIFRKRLFKTRFGLRIQKVYLGFVDGLSTVKKVSRPGWFIFHSINIWVMYFSMSYLCFFAYGPTSHLGLNAGLVVFVFGAWGVVFPSPGGMGTYHYMVQLALGIYGISGEDSFSFANIAFFSIQLGCNVLFGLIALISLPFLNRNYQPAKISPAYELQ